MTRACARVKTPLVGWASPILPPPLALVAGVGLSSFYSLGLVSWDFVGD
jgi:hypothetical protein